VLSGQLAEPQLAITRKPVKIVKRTNVKNDRRMMWMLLHKMIDFTGTSSVPNVKMQNV
jgi:hypothetical protein